MGIILRFKVGDSGSQVNLQAGEQGFQLSGQGWSPAIATPVYMGEPPPVIENIHLYVKHGTHDIIATMMQNLHEMQVLADRYMKDPTQGDPVWLEAQLAGETYHRRTLVHSISAQFKSSWFGSEATAEDIPLVLTVIRNPYWERPTPRNLPDSGNKTGAGMVYDYTAAGDVVGAHDIVGDVGARLRMFDIEAYNGSKSHFYLGFRSANKRGATGLSNFVSKWECEDGANNGSESGIADTADASASGGTKVRLTETDLDWDTDTYLKVLDLKLDNVTANFGDQFGKFIWLLRAQVNAGSNSWDVKLRISPDLNTSDYIYLDPITIDVAGWQYYEMGIFDIGLRNPHAHPDIADDDERDFSVSIYARRTSGASTIDFDCLVPIPIDEGFLKVIGPGSTLAEARIGRSPEGHLAAVGTSTTDDHIISFSPIESEFNFHLPLGDGRIYCVSDFPGSDDINDGAIFNNADSGRYYERWLSLRGSE